MLTNYRPVDVPNHKTADITVANRQAGGLLEIAEADYQKIERILASIVRTVNTMCRELADGNPASACEDLHIAPELRQLVPTSWKPWSTDLCRADFVLSRGQPRLLEINSGCAVGGSIDAEAFIDASTAQKPTVPGRMLPNTARIKWACGVCREIGADKLFLPIWPWIHVADRPRYFASSVAAARQEGIALVIVPFDRFVKICEMSPQPIVALKLFATLDALRNQVQLDSLHYGSHLGNVVWLQTEETAVASSKAMLTEEFAGQVPKEVRGALPKSWLLNYSQNRIVAVKHKNELVAKPLNDHGGAGVVFGRTMSSRDWETVVDQYGSIGGVVQQVVTVDEVEMEIVDKRTGSRADFTGGCAFGAYFIRDKLVGILARIGGPAPTLRPINGNTGAVLTALVPRSAKSFKGN